MENIKDSVLSEEKRKEKIDEIKKRAERTREDLGNKMNSLKDKAKEEAQTLLDSLNEIINFKLTLWDNNTSTETTQWSPNKGKNVFVSIKDWIKEQRDDVGKTDKRKKEPWKNIARTAWIGAVLIWGIGLTIKWFKKLWNWAFSRDKKGE